MLPRSPVTDEATPPDGHLARKPLALRVAQLPLGDERREVLGQLGQVGPVGDGPEFGRASHLAAVRVVARERLRGGGARRYQEQCGASFQRH